MVRIYDISLKINNDTIVYPGNEKISIHQYTSIPINSVNESWIKFGCHTGTHVDAPRHINNNGKMADEISLNTFYGNCKVLDLTDIDLEIHREDLEKFQILKDDIILLKTKNSLRGYKEMQLNI